MSKIKTFLNDDYCAADFGKDECYFGYEEQWCKQHKKRCDESCRESDCEGKGVTEWCFTATIKGREFFIPLSKIKKYMAYPEDSEDITRCLLAGMMMVIKEVTKK